MKIESLPHWNIPWYVKVFIVDREDFPEIGALEVGDEQKCKNVKINNMVKIIIIKIKK